jgi:hypothetical protein
MLEAGYYLLLIACILIIGAGFDRAIKKSGLNNKFLVGYYLFFAGWIGYISILSFSGTLTLDVRPPRLPLLIILPAFAIIAWFFISNRFKSIIEAFPLQLTVYYQSFRIVVELLIFGAYIKGLGPVHVSFEGYNFDILAGITAPVIGLLAFRGGKIRSNLLVLWNIGCLLLLANIVIIFNTLILNPSIWGFESTPVKEEMFTLPYLFIAAVYMPTAVFMHVFSLRKIALLKKRKSHLL